MNISSKNTPKKIVKKQGRPLKYTTVDDAQSSCRVCKCLFRVQYGNDEKFKQISRENIFEPTTRKDIENKSTLVDMCFQMGLIIEANERLSKRICKPCGCKIRKAHECFTFTRSNLDSPTAHAQTFDTLVSNQRFKRQLPSTITPEQIRSQTIKKTSTASQKAQKALDYDEIEIENETPNNDAIMSASSSRLRVKGDFHAWRVFLARRVDAAWKSRYKFRVLHPPVRGPHDIAYPRA